MRKRLVLTAVLSVLNVVLPGAASVVSVSYAQEEPRAEAGT
ncbi:MAG: hypothetical protein ACREQO_18355 [Candidatus Binatia bacterium]